MIPKGYDEIEKWSERAKQLIAESPFAERLQPLAAKPWWGQIPYEMIYDVHEYANRSQIPDIFNPTRVPNSYGTLFYIFGITKAERPLFIAQDVMKRYLDLCENGLDEPGPMLNYALAKNKEEKLEEKQNKRHEDHDNRIISFWSPQEELLHAGLDLGHALGDGVIFHQPLPRGAAYEVLPSAMILSQLPNQTSYRYNRIRTDVILQDLIQTS